MEGDAGPGQLTPTPPLTADETVVPDPKLSDHVDDAGISAPEQAAPTADPGCRPGDGCPPSPGSHAAAALLLITAGRSPCGPPPPMRRLPPGRLQRWQRRRSNTTATQAPDVKAMDASQRKIVECSTKTVAQANLYGDCSPMPTRR